MEIVRSSLQSTQPLDVGAEEAHDDVAEANADIAELHHERRSLLQEKKRVEQELEDERKVSTALEDQVVALREQVSVGRRQSEMQERLQAEENKRQVESLQRQVRDLRQSESKARSELAAMQSAEQDWHTQEARLSGELEEAAGALQRQLQVASTDRRRSQDLEEQLSESRKREEELRTQLQVNAATRGEPATGINQLPEGAELCELDGVYYYVDESTGRLFSAEAPYLQLGTVNEDGEAELQGAVPSSDQDSKQLPEKSDERNPKGSSLPAGAELAELDGVYVDESTGKLFSAEEPHPQVGTVNSEGEVDFLDEAESIKQELGAYTAPMEEEREELKARCLAYEAEIEQLTGLLASEKQTAAKLRLDMQEHSSANRDLWQENAKLQAQTRQEQQARQLAEQAHQQALEVLQQRQEEKRMPGKQETSAIAKTLRQAEQLQQYEEQLAACAQEIAMLRAARDEPAERPGRRPKAVARIDAEQTEHGETPATLDQALRELAKAQASLLQTRAHAAERESELAEQLNKQEQEFQALQQELQPIQDAAMSEGLGEESGAATDASVWMEQLASRNQQIKLLQARLGRYAERQQQLEEKLSRQMQQNASLAERLEGNAATMQTGEEQSMEVQTSVAEKMALEEALREKEKELEIVRAKLGMQAEREQHTLADVAGQLQELEALRDEVQLLRDGIPSPTRGRPSQASFAESPPPPASPEEAMTAKMAKEVEALKARVAQQAEQEHEMRSELAVQSQLAHDLQVHCDELESTMEKWKEAGRAMPRDGGSEELRAEGLEHTKAALALESKLAAKNKDLEQLRKRLGKQAEREQQILEKLSTVEQEATQGDQQHALEPKEKDMAEKIAKTDDGGALERATARIRTLERSVAGKVKELEQLRSRLCAQTEDEQLAKSELASARLETEHWHQVAEKLQKAVEAQETMARSKHEVNEDTDITAGVSHAKDLELEQLRNRLGRLAEREQAAVEQANLHQGQVDALRAENAALQEVAAIHMAQQRQAISASAVPVANENSEVVAAKSREVEQLRGRLAAQAERENEIMTKLAMKEEELAQLQHEKADALSKLSSLRDRKGSQPSEPSAMEHLKSRLNAKEQELETMRNKAFQERASSGKKLQNAEERASRLQVELEQLLFEKKQWQKREEELLKSQATAVERPSPVQPERKALESAKRETEELRVRLTRECAANAERQQKDRDEVFFLQQKLLETEAALEKLQRIVKLAKYQESMQKVKEEEEAEEENLRYESYDTGFAADSNESRKKREQKDTILRTVNRERELMRMHRDRVDQICEIQAEQVAALRKAAGGDSLLKVETLLAHRSHELEQTRKQLELARMQLERRDQSRATEAESLQRLNEELSQHKQDLDAKQVELNDALRDRDFWEARHKMLQETQNLLLSELEAERERLKKQEIQPEEQQLVTEHQDTQERDTLNEREEPELQRSEEDANATEGWRSQLAPRSQRAESTVLCSAGEFAKFEPDDELSAAKSCLCAVDEPVSHCIEPLLSLPPAREDAIWNEVDTWSAGPTATQPAPRILGEDASRPHLALRHAIVSVPSAPEGNARSPWRRFLPDSMLRTSSGRTIPSSELAVGMFLVGPDGAVQVVAVRWMSSEKHNIVTIPTGRGVFSVVAEHWLVARTTSSSTAMAQSHDWDAIAAADLKEGAHEVVIHGPDDMCEAAVLTSTRWKSHKSWTVEAEFSGTEEIFMYVQPAALRSGARSSRPQQQRGRHRTPPPLGR